MAVMTGSALRDKKSDIQVPVMCPMCHTGSPLSPHAIAAGAEWRCVRCGQLWDAPRLVTVATYDTWVTDRDRAGRLAGTT